ncbi:MAG: hypothetical protein AB7D46_01645 [Flavobacteriaceae bacterium]
MFKKFLLILTLFCFSFAFAQEINSLYVSEKIQVVADTISLQNQNLNPAFFEVKDQNGKVIPKEKYHIDFEGGKLIFTDLEIETEVEIFYLKIPGFLTQEYSIYDENRVVSNEEYDGMLYSLDVGIPKRFVPFEGLNTSGSISRGVTVGNNQNAVTNSSLDLQITGKLSDNVSIRASIQDSNIPIQEGGYSQRLDEFDQIFIELFSDTWNIRAGDLFLENRQSRFLNFNKKVQGISTNFSFGDENKTTVFSSVGLVRGQYARSSFTGQEGNQGPYKLRGNNGELYVLVVSGSERVYVNGILLERGEDKQYVIDYNAGEVIFTSLFPITSEMRINIEYQFSERNYTRFIAYGGVIHEREKWNIGGFVYSENDMKNQSLQQNLSPEQVEILKNAGNDSEQMIASSAYEDSYSENRILYKKVWISGVEVFEFSNNPEDELYNVRFTLVGQGNGNYILANNQAIGKIYQYVEPIGGIPQGNYEPIIRLVAPEKIQMATLLGGYHTEKTQADFEVGMSNNDKNLFSDIDDQNNQGFAGRVKMNQRVLSGEYQVDAFTDYQFVDKNFRTIERLFTIEFDRDWNINTIMNSSQSLLIAGTKAKLKNNGFVNYQFEKLDFSDQFNANRNVLNTNLKFDKLTVQSENSILNSDGNYSTTDFTRSQTQARYHFDKNWVGTSLRLEDNSERLKENNSLSNLSQRFIEYGGFVGRGDSTKVYLQLGYLHRKNDSLMGGTIQRVNQSNSFYAKSRLLQTQTSDLSVFVNYRILKYADNGLPKEPSLNSRIVYSDRFFNQLVQLNTSFETMSGSLAQQEFTYLEVEPGQGVYMWNDYNGNGIQELEEFEIAVFSDQARYIRVFLPNQVFVKTHQNRFSNSLTLNPTQWQNEKGMKKILSYFYNQTSFLVDRKIERNEDNFDLNPFGGDSDEILALNTNVRNSLFYNRGKQEHSVTYTYLLSEAKSLLSVGSVSNKTGSHQLQYNHLFSGIWLMNLSTKTVLTETTSENYDTRNFRIETYNLHPKLSYLFTKNTSLDVFYEFQNKKNTTGNLEELVQHRVGLSFSFSGKKGFTSTGEFSLYENDFTGNSLSPVAYQMLEGLQAGQNLTWRLLLQKNLTQYLDLNLNYEGRKSETSKTIHTGSVQLRAFF